MMAMQPPYGIDEHNHRFAAWAASRAASVKGCRFSVRHGRDVLEHCGLNANLSEPDQLPGPKEIDAEHTKWRNAICAHSAKLGIPMTHGVAAKLINVYLKARFVCRPHHEHAKVCALHPPIDKLLLDALAKVNFGREKKLWRQASRNGWSKLSSNDYQDLICAMRNHLKGKPFWTIEIYWRGHQ